MAGVLQYFTEKGADKVIEDYKYLIGNEYYFSAQEKRMVLDIQKFPGIAKNGFNVLICSDKIKLSIYDFMQLNKEIAYSFNNYENFSVEA